MTCPDCGGTGRIPARFLFFFTRRARCRTCWGTGEYPPRPGPQVRFRQGPDDDDRWTPPVFGVPFGGSSAPADTFEVGSGGRSAGGGATASWSDPSSGPPPVIADPFAGDAAPAAGSVAAADAVDASPSPSSQSNDGGTSY